MMQGLHQIFLHLQVHLLGKPDPVIYEQALKLLGLPADQVLAVGDSVEHDIKVNDIHIVMHPICISHSCDDKGFPTANGHLSACRQVCIGLG